MSAQSTADPPEQRGVRYIDFPETEFEFKRKYGSKGIAIVINNAEFQPNTDLPNRPDSYKRHEDICKAIKYLGLRDIRPYNNLKATVMMDTLNEVAEEPFNKVDCLVVVLMSYGDEKNLYAIDKTISYEMLLEPFKVLGLKGVPKIFIVQAYRPPPGVSIPRYDPNQARNTPPRLRVEYDAAIHGPRTPYPVYKELDSLLVYSILEGYEFIDTLCAVFLHDGRRLEIMKLLARTIRMMSYGIGALPADCKPHKTLPSPCVVSMLSKDFYFH